MHRTGTCLHDSPPEAYSWQESHDLARVGYDSQEIVRQDIRDLERLGYAQQLFREMGDFSNFTISFSIISVLTGAVLLYGYGLKFAGPVVKSVGWPLVSVLTLCVAASMAELASAYPTAGGLYFWAFRLGGRTWAWVTAWLNMSVVITTRSGFSSRRAQSWARWRRPPSISSAARRRPSSSAS